MPGDAIAGRPAELAAVTALLDGVRSGTGRALVVRGEPGVGKSALLRHAAGRAAPRESCGPPAPNRRAVSPSPPCTSCCGRSRA
ncbi:ATP-binding protein [Streptomyces zhihengii]